MILLVKLIPVARAFTYFLFLCFRSGIPPEKLDGMFRFFEHVSGLAEFELKESPAGKRYYASKLWIHSNEKISAGKTPEVGLGLAQVARSKFRRNPSIELFANGFASLFQSSKLFTEQCQSHRTSEKVLNSSSEYHSKRFRLHQNQKIF